MSLLKLDQSGCEIESVPPLVKWAKSAHLPPLTPTSTFQRFDGGKTVQAHTDAAMREYGELCHKQALEEAYKWMLDRHEAQKHRDNYMLVEANRFKKELLTLPRVEQGSVPKQVKPDGSGEVVRTVTLDVVQAKAQPSEQHNHHNSWTLKPHNGLDPRVRGVSPTSVIQRFKHVQIELAHLDILVHVDGLVTVFLDEPPNQ